MNQYNQATPGKLAACFPCCQTLRMQAAVPSCSMPLWLLPDCTAVGPHQWEATR
jgi:hypothetical protein